LRFRNTAEQPLSFRTPEAISFVCKPATLICKPTVITTAKMTVIDFDVEQTDAAVLRALA